MQKLKSKLIEINRTLIALTRLIILICFSSLILSVSLNVVLRYIFKSPVFWVTEFSCYCLVYCVLFGAVLALYRGEHVGIYVGDLKFPKEIKKFIHLMTNLTILIFILIMIPFGMILTLDNIESYTGSLPIPMGVVYIAIPLSGVIMLFLHTEKFLFERKKL